MSMKEIFDYDERDYCDDFYRICQNCGRTAESCGFCEWCGDELSEQYCDEDDFDETYYSNYWDY